MKFDNDLIEAHGKTFHDFVKRGGAWDFVNNKPVFKK